MDGQRYQFEALEEGRFNTYICTNGKAFISKKEREGIRNLNGEGFDS
jgi:hypothetical protein